MQIIPNRNYFLKQFYLALEWNTSYLLFCSKRLTFKVLLCQRTFIKVVIRYIFSAPLLFLHLQQRPVLPMTSIPAFVLFLPFETSHPMSYAHITLLDGFNLINKSMLCCQQEKVVANLHYMSALQENSTLNLNNVRVVPSSVRFILEQVAKFNIPL